MLHKPYKKKIFKDTWERPGESEGIIMNANTNKATEIINNKPMTTAELMTARLAKNTVFGEALYELKRSIPGYTETVQIPSEEDGQFDYVIRYPEDDEAPVIVLRHTCHIRIYFEYKFYTFDILDPDLDKEIEVLPGADDCECVNPFDIMERVVERISSEIRYNDLLLAMRRYRQ